jgi:hypothetical protein
VAFVPDTPGEADRQRSAEARRRNEHLKLAAGAPDRVSTVVLGGAVLAPFFQHAPPRWQETGGWILVALVLHAAAHYVRGRLREEI